MENKVVKVLKFLNSNSEICILNPQIYKLFGNLILENEIKNSELKNRIKIIYTEFSNKYKEEIKSFEYDLNVEAIVKILKKNSNLSSNKKLQIVMELKDQNLGVERLKLKIFEYIENINISEKNFSNDKNLKKENYILSKNTQNKLNKKFKSVLNLLKYQAILNFFILFLVIIMICRRLLPNTFKDDNLNQMFLIWIVIEISIFIKIFIGILIWLKELKIKKENFNSDTVKNAAIFHSLEIFISVSPYLYLFVLIISIILLMYSILIVNKELKK